MSQPPLRKRRYPPSVEQARTALVACAALMGLVGFELLDELTGPKPGIGMDMLTAFHRWFTELRGARLGLSASDMLWVVTSLHILTAGFLLVLDRLGGRSAFLSALKTGAPVVLVWGTGIAGALGFAGHFALAAGLGLASITGMLLISLGIVAGNEMAEAERPAGEEEDDEAPEDDEAEDGAPEDDEGSAAVLDPGSEDALQSGSEPL